MLFNFIFSDRTKQNIIRDGVLIKFTYAMKRGFSEKPAQICFGRKYNGGLRIMDHHPWLVQCNKKLPCWGYTSLNDIQTFKEQIWTL
jgi:hypothetical protein